MTAMITSPFFYPALSPSFHRKENKSNTIQYIIENSIKAKHILSMTVNTCILIN